MAELERVFLETGDKELNNLLNADDGDKGLCAGRLIVEGGKVTDTDGKVQFDETSIVLIEGGAGTGKTTLALQIASAVAGKIREQEPKNWTVIYLSLEQTPSSLRHVAESFGFGGKNGPKMFPILAADTQPEAHQVLFSRLSPLPLSESKKDTAAENTFETRFAELQHMALKQSSATDYRALFVIDSLSAFIGKPLERSQLYQLFTLFRTQKIPLIVTLEQPDNTNSSGGSEFEIPCFLADIVIKLTREPGSDYLQFYLEVSKSRVCRQGLGKHLYKTRTVEYAKETGDKDRTGLVVYPSVHFILSQARSDQVKSPHDGFIIAKELNKEELLDLEPLIKHPACFALQGPAGTHKLALGLNLGVSYVVETGMDKDKEEFIKQFQCRFKVAKLPEFLKAKLLVVTFGGQGEIKFDGVAWLKEQSYLRELINPTDTSATQSGKTKQTQETYCASNYKKILNLERIYETDSVCAKRAEVTVLTFQIGVLTPEECIYRIREVLNQQPEESPFHSVLISDTAELCTGFPLLSKDPMFFVALLDLFASKRLLTVGLGVRSPDSPYLRDINLALMAKATHRMRFYHYPEVEELMEEMVDDKRRKENPKGKELTPLTEQLVSVVIDNVTGKHYKREPKWMRVEEGDPMKIMVSGREELYKPKILKFLTFDDPGIILDAKAKIANTALTQEEGKTIDV